MSEEKEKYEAVKPTVPMGTLQVAPDLVFCYVLLLENKSKPEHHG